MILAQLGAEVIAIEPPEGQRARRQRPYANNTVDPEKSLTHWAYNRGKQSLTLNLADARDLRRLEQLAATADAVIDSGASGIDLASLRGKHSHLVTRSEEHTSELQSQD